MIVFQKSSVIFTIISSSQLIKTHIKKISQNIAKIQYITPYGAINIHSKRSCKALETDIC